MELKCPNCGVDLKEVLEATVAPENVVAPEQAEAPAVTPEAETPAVDAPATDEQSS